MSGTITPCLWFAQDAEPAARLYTGIFADSAIDTVSHYGENMPMPAGSVLLVDFTLRGQPFQALNGGTPMAPSEAISLSVDCADLAELDHIWNGLLAGGGSPIQCGWLKDRFGISWQIVPRVMAEMIKRGTPEQVGRLMQAMMPMVKLDIAALEAAYRGE